MKNIIIWNLGCQIFVEKFIFQLFVVQKLQLRYFHWKFDTFMEKLILNWQAVVRNNTRECIQVYIYCWLSLRVSFPSNSNRRWISSSHVHVQFAYSCKIIVPVADEFFREWLHKSAKCTAAGRFYHIDPRSENRKRKPQRAYNVSR